MQNQKNLFSLKEGVHYFNCAYKAPLLKSAEAIAIQELIKMRNPQELTTKDFFETTQDVRRLFSQIINCRPSQIAVIPSASYGVSSMLKNVPCQKGQHALTIENEFPSDYFGLQRWCEIHQSTLKVICPNHQLKTIGEDWNERIINSITSETAVVVMSITHWMNGVKFDVKRIGEQCKKMGAYFIIDGTQSVGALPMDVEACHIDALICPTYKWLLGPYSVGLMYVGSKFYNGIPLEESWMNRTNAQNFSQLTDYDSNYLPDAGRYNVGESSYFILMPMLKVALQQLNEWTIPAIQDYCIQLTQPLFDYLEDKGATIEPPLYRSPHLFGLTLSEGKNMAQVKENLQKNNIFISVRGDSLRVSVNVFNTQEDIEKLIKVLG